MMNFIKLTLSCLGLALVLAACGKSDNNSSATTCQPGYMWNGSTCVYYGYGYGHGYNTCQAAGQIQTQYGCLPPCPGNPTYGQMTNGQCVPPVTTPGYPGHPGYNGGYPHYGWPGSGWGYNCRFVMRGGLYYYYCY